MTEETLFLAALDINSPAERSAWLDKNCQGDEHLRRRVEALLRAHESSRDFLNQPAFEQGSSQDSCDGERTKALDGSADPVRNGASATLANSGRAKTDESLVFLSAPQKEGSLGRLGHYEMLEILGQGAFGIVFKAFDDKLQRVVAVKVMEPHLSASGTARKRFLREARAAAGVRHENIIKIHAVEEQPLPYLVMECVVGQTLQAKIDKSGPLEVREILRIGFQIACGLSAAHQQGLVHRDIKPANILLENGVDRVKITDFGLARSVDDASLTQSGMLAGTPMYMSPEQANGVAVDQRADLFSLGSTLYVMCTGRPPFRAHTSLAVLKRVSEDRPHPIGQINPEMPEWLVAVVDRLQAKQPADRYQSAEEVADLLKTFLADVQLHGTVLPVPAMPRPPRRWPLLTAVALALLALLVTAGLSIPGWHSSGGQQSKVQPDSTSEIRKGMLVAADSPTDILTSADWVWSEPENLGPGVNTAGVERNPTLTADGLLLIFERNGHLWTSQRKSIDEPFPVAEILPEPINTNNVEIAPALSGDGLILLYVSIREDREEVWMTTRPALDAPWSEPVKMGPEVNHDDGANRSPWLSFDGLTLIVSNRFLGGFGGNDIWMLTRKERSEPFGNLMNLGPNVNTARFDAGAALSSDGRTLLFVRQLGPHDQRVMMSVRPTLEKPFGPALELGPPLTLTQPYLNSGLTLSIDGRFLYFHSERPGSEGKNDLWLSRRVPKK